jgi:hypothetical protein
MKRNGIRGEGNKERRRWEKRKVKFKEEGNRGRRSSKGK